MIQEKLYQINDRFIKFTVIYVMGTKCDFIIFILDCELFHFYYKYGNPDLFNLGF